MLVFIAVLCLWSLFDAHCVINMNISAIVSGLNSGNVIQFSIVLFALCYYSQHYCDYSVTVISSSLAGVTLICRYFTLFPCVDRLIDCIIVITV